MTEIADRNAARAAAEARLAALRQDPRVIIHYGTATEPYEPVIQGRLNSTY